MTTQLPLHATRLVYNIQQDRIEFLSNPPTLPPAVIVVLTFVREIIETRLTDLLLEMPISRQYLGSLDTSKTVSRDESSDNQHD